MIHDNHVEKVEERWLQYAKVASSLEVDAILSACSTVGAFAEKANELLDVPVYRIDEAMAEAAVEKGETISIFATLSSTLEPTVNLIQRKAKTHGKQCKLNSILVADAYEELMKGNRKAHDKKIQEEILKYIDTSDAIVLAQASMASAIDGLEGISQDKVLTSPNLGIARLKRDLA
jgi:Asp/Glu/hydantoin racemase